jgi:hypothetical protein
MPYRWTPPPGYAELTIPGNSKVYHPGDMVPISKDLAEHMMRYTPHVFEGIDAPEPPGPAGIPAQPLAARSRLAVEHQI